MSDTLTEPRIRIADPETDDNEVAHIVKREAANAGYIGQEMIEALCGFKWIPNKNPENLPICRKCMYILELYRNGELN